jgi:hypothetical protein
MEHEAVLYFQETPMKIKIPLLSGPDEVADVRHTRIYYYYYYFLVPPLSCSLFELRPFFVLRSFVPPSSTR